MSNKSVTLSGMQLKSENDDLRFRLAQAEAQLNAIRGQGHAGVDKTLIINVSDNINKIERKAASSDDKFKKLVWNMQVGVLLQGPQAEILMSNPKALELLGLTEDQLLGRTSFDPSWNVIHQDGSPFPGHTHPVPQSIESRQPVRNVVMGVYQPNTGSRVWLLVDAEPQLMDDGSIEQVVCTFIDITERVMFEKVLMEAKLQAEEGDRLKTAFLMNISHEIRTPMNGILGFLSLLDQPGLEEKTRQQYIDNVNKSGYRLLDTISDLIEMSKIEAEQPTVTLQTVNIMDVMRYQYNFFRKLSNEKRLEMHLNEQIGERNAIVKTDKSKLEGIIAILLKNAIKFTSKGAITLGNYLEKDMMVFFVRDSGEGIAPDRQGAIFNRFIQADMKLNRAHEGLGLGLTIAKSHLKAMGGEIWVDSEVGKGSSFYFSIPYISAHNQKGAEIPGSAVLNASLSVPLILIVEDDEISYQMLKIVLLKTNVRLLHAVNGAVAVKMVRENPAISLILMDIKMPVMDGLEATREIRKFNKTIPVIAQTAHIFSDEKENARIAGCNDHISKPINHKELIALVKKYTMQ